jgi:hypothetical protein
MSERREENKTERKIFVCKHVIEGARIAGDMLDGETEGVVVAMLCDPCYWPNVAEVMMNPEPGGCIYAQSKEGLAELDGELFTESEVVSRGWLPRSRAMQFVRFMIQDYTGGMAISSPLRLFYRRMHGSGLTDREEMYLWNLYDRTSSDLTPRQEARAMRLVEKARAGFRKTDESAVISEAGTVRR